MNKMSEHPVPELGNSVSDRFSKELNQHGYLKHSNTMPKSYAPPQKVQPENPYESNIDQTGEDIEPYRREAGKTSLRNHGTTYRNENIQPNENYQKTHEATARQASQNERDIGSRNMNRRLVEENLLRNASADRHLDNDTSKMYEGANLNNNSFNHKYTNQIDPRLGQQVNNYNNQPQGYNNFPEKYMNPEEKAYYEIMQGKL